MSSKSGLEKDLEILSRRLALIFLFSVFLLYSPVISFFHVFVRGDFSARAKEKTTNLLIINEIAWMGSKENWREEWIELYNNTDQDINLSGWKIKIGKQNEGVSEKKEISLSGTIKARAYFLLKRGEEKRLNGIDADMTFKKSLDNDGADIILVDPQNKEADAIICSNGWFFGSNLTKKTMERISPDQEGSDPKNWRNSSFVGGTPRAKNSGEKTKGDYRPLSFVNKHPDSAKKNIFAALSQYYFYEYKAALIPLFLGTLFSLVLTSLLIIYTKKKN